MQGIDSDTVSIKEFITKSFDLTICMNYFDGIKLHIGRLDDVIKYKSTVNAINIRDIRKYKDNCLIVDGRIQKYKETRDRY